MISNNQTVLANACRVVCALPFGFSPLPKRNIERRREKFSFPLHAMSKNYDSDIMEKAKKERKASDGSNRE